jgi:hypothetical protein
MIASMRWWIWLALAGCGVEISNSVNLQHANLRVPFQTDPARVLVYQGDVDQPYDVLSDLEITMRQRSAMGEMPTHEAGIRALQEQAGRIGAHAIIMVSFGEKGMSLWSYNEMKGQGRAIRFR